MKSVFVILALAALAGCSNMPWKSSSGEMGSRRMESGSGAVSSEMGVYSDRTRGLYNPYTPNSNLPVPITP